MDFEVFRDLELSHMDFESDPERSMPDLSHRHDPARLRLLGSARVRVKRAACGHERIGQAPIERIPAYPESRLRKRQWRQAAPADMIVRRSVEMGIGEDLPQSEALDRRSGQAREEFPANPVAGIPAGLKKRCWHPGSLQSHHIPERAEG